MVGIISVFVTQPAGAKSQLENQDKLILKSIDNSTQQIKPTPPGKISQRNFTVACAAFLSQLPTGKDCSLVKSKDEVLSQPCVHYRKKQVNELNKVSVLSGESDDFLLLQKGKGEQKVRQISEIERPSTSAMMLVQLPTPTNPPEQQGVIEVTGVKAIPTEKGVEVILQTTLGEKLQITNRSAENNFIADILNAQLRLSNGDAFTFSSQNPIQGISKITVTNFDANTIRVTVVGETGLPTVELFDTDEGLIFALTSATTAMQPEVEQPTTSETPSDEPAARGDEPIELVVTGEPDSYRVPNTSVGTRTDTPLRDIPQSIQVVPQQVLKDQQVTTLREALRNIPGTAQGTNPSTRGLAAFPLIRGFDATLDILRNGLRDTSNSNTGFDVANIERIEVLKGPASVLFGQGSPGGAINLVTKKPLRDPFYLAEFSVGNYDFYRGAIDLTGPLNESRTVLYRLNLAAQTTGSFIDFYDGQQYLVAPTLSWQISDRTRLTLTAEYLNRPKSSGQQGLPVVGTVLPNPNGRIPRNRNLGEPDATDDSVAIRVGYDLEHQFSDNWQIRNAFRFSRVDFPSRELFTNVGLAINNRIVSRNFSVSDVFRQFFNIDTYVVGQFATGSIRHQLVTGFNLTRDELGFVNSTRQASPIDLFNPIYGRPLGDFISNSESYSKTDTLGIYIQDQVTLAEDLKLLLGVRFDTFNSRSETETFTPEVSGDAFSPRIGIVYQPITPISLYASYTRSFNPISGVTFEGSAFQPERGTQYEVGIKADLNARLSATLAFFDLTRSNVSTADTRLGIPPGFSIQTGEQRSKGFELSLAGEIVPGWNIIAGYSYTDAQITQDNTNLVGNQLNLIPQNTFNLWTSYEFQRAPLRGFGVGAGFFFVGEREGDLANTFRLPSYLITEAALFYKRRQFRASLNFKNLFDVDYFETASNNRLNVFPGEPFTVQGTISFEF
ncbi:TonB-dependent siderophore receptor [Scytonema sp. NUACC21]